MFFQMLEISLWQVGAVFISLWVGVELLRRVFSHPLDSAEARRKAFPPEPGRHPHLLPADALNGLKQESGFFEGMWWQVLIPKGSPTCLVIGVHGYADHSDYLMINHAREVALKNNALVFLFDQTGFGRSDGLWAFIPDWFRHVASCGRIIEFAKKKFPGLKTFGLGFSMGGAVLLSLCIEHKHVFDGMILLAPMCRIADHLKPSSLIMAILRVVSLLVPDLPVTPVPDLAMYAYREPRLFNAILARNHLNYKMQPRLATAWEMVRAQNWMEQNMEKVKTPFIILHGSADMIVDHSSSQELVKRASSEDKELVLLPGYAHCIMGAGQPVELSLKPYALVTEWLKVRI